MALLPLDTSDETTPSNLLGTDNSLRNSSFRLDDAVIAGRRRDNRGNGVPDKHIDMLPLDSDGNLMVKVRAEESAWGDVPSPWSGSPWSGSAW